MTHACVLLVVTGSLLAGCDPCPTASERGSNDAMEDVYACAPYGTTHDAGPRGGNGEWENCYETAYMVSYYAYYDDQCLERGPNGATR